MLGQDTFYGTNCSTERRASGEPAGDVRMAAGLSAQGEGDSALSQAGGGMKAQRPSSCAAGGCCWTRVLVLSIALMAAMLPSTSPLHAAAARLTISPLTVSFPSSDPDVVPSVAASENPISVRVQIEGSPSMVSQLTAATGGELVSGSNIIPISKVTWTASGSGYVSGRLSSSQPQLVGQWLGKNDSQGQLRFWLENSWSYAVGAYSQNLVYTLIAY